MTRAWLLVGLLAGPAAAQVGPEGAILAEIERYDTQIVALDAQIAGLATQVAEAQARRDAAGVDAAQADAEVSRRREHVTRELRSFYRLKRQGILPVLFGARDPLDLRRRLYYLLSVLRVEGARQVSFAEALAHRAEAARTAQAEAEAAAALQAQLTTQRAGLDEERRRRRELLANIRGSTALQGRAVVETRQAQVELDASVKAREGSAPEVVAGSDGAAFRAAKGRLPSPVAGTLLRGFGTTTDPGTGEELRNLGLDLAAPLGTPFRAVFAGTVTRSGYVRGYGQMVMVEHGTYATLYAHANGLRVVQGQAVQQGDVLGLVGTTGLALDETPRLHFEIRYNGTAQDPAPWLGR